MYLQHYVFSINELFTISFFYTNSQPLSFIQRNEHVEMNNFSCSLSCTWMTIIDCLFYASDSLISEMFHGSILLNCLLRGCNWPWNRNIDENVQNNNNVYIVLYFHK